MRGLDSKFLNAMREGLENGRRKGYQGWDQHWNGVYFPYSPTQFMVDRLHQELDELIIALHEGDPDKIMREAADVANFAMFIADLKKSNKGNTPDPNYKGVVCGKCGAEGQHFEFECPL